MAECRALHVSPSGFYAWQQRPKSARARRDRHLRLRIRASHDASRQRYGRPRIWKDLREEGEPVSQKRVSRLMRADGLRARPRKRFRSTTMSEHDQPVAANVLARQFDAERPNQRWVGDTTEFVIGTRGKLYLAAILDVYSRFIVGWALSAVNDRHLTLRTLEMALRSVPLPVPEKGMAQFIADGGVDPPAAAGPSWWRRAADLSHGSSLRIKELTAGGAWTGDVVPAPAAAT